MDPLCLSAARLVLLSILVAGAQGYDTSAPSQHRPGFCLEPPFQGPGKAVIPRFFFNAESELCEAFVFGGGRAKLNNFQTEEECTRVCSGHGPALHAQVKRELEAQPEPEDKIVDEIKGSLEDKIEDRDTDENSEDDGEVEDETEIKIEYRMDDEVMDRKYKDSSEEEDKNNIQYGEEPQIEIEYGAQY